MNILLLTSEITVRGGEKQTRLLYDGLRQKGFHPHVGGAYEAQILKDLPTQDHVFSCKKRFFFHPSNILSLIRYCKTHNIDLIDAQSSKAHSMALIAIYALKHTKLVIHRRVDNPFGGYLFGKKKYLSSKISAYVAISKDIANRIKESGFRGLIFQVNSAVMAPQSYLTEDEKNILKTKLGIQDKDYVLVQVGAMTKQKGHYISLEALSFLKKYQKSFKLILVGDGSLRPNLELLADKLQIRDSVIFTGWQTDPNQFLQIADLFIMPSLNEGLGTSILDAIHYKVPVVASQVGGIPEIIIHEKTGWLIPPHPQALCERIWKIYSSPLLCEPIKDKALEHVHRAFSVENMVEGNIEIYENILKN